MSSSKRRKALHFFVALDGNDAWAGCLPQANRAGDDGPFRTPERARQAIRDLRSAHDGQLPLPVTVSLRAGTYFLNEPWVLEPEDSGTATCPVTYAAWRNEAVTLSGGRRLTGWRPTAVNSQVGWVTEAPRDAAGEVVGFKQLWVNGTRRFRPRYPRTGFLHVGEVPGLTAETKHSEGQDSFHFATGDIRPWRNLTDAEIIVNHFWVNARLPIAEVDWDKRLVCCACRSYRRLTENGVQSPARYYVENVFEELCEPGQWYLDRVAGLVYYLPLPGETPDSAEIIYPVLRNVLLLQGDPGDGRYVEHVRFRGLAFAHTAWALVPGDAGDSQAAAQRAEPVGVVSGQGVRHCAFAGCCVEHAGDWGLELIWGCQDNRITRCDVRDLGSGGIRIGPSFRRVAVAGGEEHRRLAASTATQAVFDDCRWHACRNRIEDCTVTDGGHVFAAGIGIWLGQTYANRVAHNHVHNFYYTGISAGWTWGYQATLARENRIEHNHIHHIGIRESGVGPIISDMGGIYTLGRQPGTVIRGNVIHDVAGFSYGGWGIYLDEGSTGIRVTNNLVYRTTHGGFHQHFGRDNMIRNNIFAFGSKAQFQRSRREDTARSFTFERNIVLWTEGDLLAEGYAGAWDPPDCRIDRNLYGAVGNGDALFAKLTLTQWRALGLDRHSLFADPLFRGAAVADFRLAPNSPAFQLGFKPFRLDFAGPRRRSLKSEEALAKPPHAQA